MATSITEPVGAVPAYIGYDVAVPVNQTAPPRQEVVSRYANIKAPAIETADVKFKRVATEEFLQTFLIGLRRMKNESPWFCQTPNQTQNQQFPWLRTEFIPTQLRYKKCETPWPSK